MDPIGLQLNPTNTGSKFANLLHLFEAIGGNAPNFVCGDEGPNNFHEQGLPHLPASGPSHGSARQPEMLCRQFWKAGDYAFSLNNGPLLPGGQNRIRVHPKFLHSNATSHKWAFGAIAELLDNAFDEVVHGATFVKVDKITNPKDESCCLLIQDDGSGMGPDSLRRCMGFGFSDKCTGSTIGQYGNGFKTSTMRLGADVIVFSRSLKERGFTQSVGLLSYTLLRNWACEDIIVPTVDYEFEATRGLFKALHRNDERKFLSNLSVLLSWSPFRTEAELQKQFNEIGAHGTRIIVFNLWLNDAGEMELDFESDNQDILISGAPRAETTDTVKRLNQMHVANQYRYSLRVYASILYLHLPQNFRIVIRGRDVDPHGLVSDLKYLQCVTYRPQVGHAFEAEVITAIGFLKDAPKLNIHGFSIYHKNRLILPFMPVLSNAALRCQGVAGVLEANFIKPTHDKQDFENSLLFQKLESRLRDMTKEYWEYHCHLVGYKPSKSFAAKHATCNMSSSTNGGHDSMLTSLSRGPTELLQEPLREHGSREPWRNRPPSTGSNDLSMFFEPVALGKRNEARVVDASGPSKVKRPAVVATDLEGTNHAARATWDKEVEQREALRLLLSEHNKLSSQCSKYEASEKELSLKVQLLTLELYKAQEDYGGLLAELASLNHVTQFKVLGRASYRII